MTLGLVVFASVAFTARRLLRRWPRRTRRSGYSRLPGDGRREILRLYSQTEKLLRSAGFGRHPLSQTFAEYAGPAERRLGASASDLAWLRRLAWAAAYDPAYHPADLLSEARYRLTRLRALLAPRRRRIR